MTDAQIRSTILFFFLSFLDEKVALRAAGKTVVLCNRLLKKSADPAKDFERIFVQASLRAWQKSKRLKPAGQAGVALDGGIDIPRQVDLGSWRQLHKDAQIEELLAVIWSKVLGFHDESIASGLDVSVGTVRYRVGRGLRLLGRTVLPGRRRG